ncbi:hypothetical protein NDU88_004636 [Pleurodeles waltl]|uniref:Uncharacterized protein n=1 Tax=Pleurodeles waltl TaxID=8319 RepID=A0AAV7NN87_PLEWA|nr:hypothetical protein NDU88_004636 [Pleurodeles waltl]
MLMTSVQDKDSATAADVTARKDGRGGSVNTRVLVLCRLRRAKSGAREAVHCLVGEEVGDRLFQEHVSRALPLLQASEYELM